MSPGDIILLEMDTARAGERKVRPAVVLSTLPGPYRRWLLCGISTQLATVVPGWDEVLDERAEWFAETGLARRSAVRLSFLATATLSPPGRLGAIPGDLLRDLRARLARQLASVPA